MSEMDKVRKELEAEKERITMILGTEPQLDAIMGGLMRQLIKKGDACRLIYHMTPEEAAILAKPIASTMEKFIEATASERASARQKTSAQ